MDSETTLDEITIPLEQSYWLLISETLLIFVVFIGVYILFKHTNRPGRFMMLFGVTVYFVWNLALLPLILNIYTYNGFPAYIFFLWPNIILISLIVSVIGFIRFAWSFKNES